MTIVASVDYTAKRIYLHADTAVGSPNPPDLDTLDIYREVRALRRTDESHRKFRPIIIGGGNVEKIAGTSYTAAYVQLLYGCRIVPYDAAHKLRVVRDTFTDDGVAGRDCFDRSTITPGVTVDIDVDFPEIEIRTVNVGGTVAPSAAEMRAALGMAAANLDTQLTEVDANVVKVNGLTVDGSGTEGDPWGPA